MKKLFRNGLMMLAAGALAVSCADYNVTDDFTAQPDPDFVEPYKDYKPVKSYIDRDKYPNLTRCHTQGNRFQQAGACSCSCCNELRQHLVRNHPHVWCNHQREGHHELPRHEGSS